MRKILTFALLSLFALAAFAEPTQGIVATVKSCPINVSLTTSAASLTPDTTATQVLVSAPTVDMYLSFIATATAGSSTGSTKVPAGAVEVFTINGSTTLSVIGTASGTVNICWVVGY